MKKYLKNIEVKSNSIRFSKILVQRIKVELRDNWFDYNLNRTNQENGTGTNESFNCVARRILVFARMRKVAPIRKKVARMREKLFLVRVTVLRRIHRTVHLSRWSPAVCMWVNIFVWEPVWLGAFWFSLGCEKVAPIQKKTSLASEKVAPMRKKVARMRKKLVLVRVNVHRRIHRVIHLSRWRSPGTN